MNKFLAATLKNPNSWPAIDNNNNNNNNNNMQHRKQVQ
jgi:hypothetical protein